MIRRNRKCDPLKGKNVICPRLYKFRERLWFEVSKLYRPCRWFSMMTDLGPRLAAVHINTETMMANWSQSQSSTTKSLIQFLWGCRRPGRGEHRRRWIRSRPCLRYRSTKPLEEQIEMYVLTKVLLCVDLSNPRTGYRIVKAWSSLDPLRALRRLWIRDQTRWGRSAAASNEWTEV